MTLHGSVEIVSTTLKFKEIYFCKNVFTRLRGVFFRREFSDEHAVLLTDCSSVHGIGVRYALDVVFLDEKNRVLEIKRLDPLGVCRCKGANQVLELRAGNANKLGIKKGQYLNLNCQRKVNENSIATLKKAGQSSQSGASMVEFLLVAPVLMYLGVGVVQMGMAYHANNILNYATFEAARTGAVNQADITKMRGELAYRLGPIFPGDGSSEGVRSAVSDAIVAVNDPLRTHIRIINPTSAVFEDFGVTDPESGETVLPSTHLKHRTTEIGGRSRVTIQDANLLKIEITHGYELRLPWLDVKLPGMDLVLRELMTIANPANAQFYLRGQIPLRAVATVRMQSDALANNVAAATEGVTRPDTEELSSADSPSSTENDLVDQSNINQGGNEQGGNEQSGNEQNDEANIAESNQEECVGAHGLPADLAITTINGEAPEGICAYIPPEEMPIAESPASESSSGFTGTC